MAEHEERNDFITGPKSRDGIVRSACTVPDTWAKDERTRDRCPKCGDDLNRLGRCKSCHLDPNGEQDRLLQSALRTLNTQWLAPTHGENTMAESTENRVQQPGEECCPQCGAPWSRHACPIAVNIVHDLYIAPGTRTADVLAEIGLGEQYSLVNGEGVAFTRDHDIHAACLHGEEFYAIRE